MIVSGAFPLALSLTPARCRSAQATGGQSHSAVLLLVQPASHSQSQGDARTASCPAMTRNTERLSPDRQPSREDIDCLKEAFKLFDCDRDGVITVEELGKVRAEISLIEEEQVCRLQRQRPSGTISHCITIVLLCCLCCKYYSLVGQTPVPYCYSYK